MDGLAGRAGNRPAADPFDWHQWRRPGPTQRQQRVDVLVAGAVMAGAVVMTLLVNSMGATVSAAPPPLGEQLAWAAALAAPLAARRRFPATVVLVVSALFIAAQMRETGDNLMPSLALFLAIYTLGAWGPDRTIARWVRVAVIVAMFGWLGVAMARDLAGPPIEFDGAAGPLDPLLASTIYLLGFNLLFFLAAYFFGNASWESARRLEELRRQGEQLRRSQAENARQAVVAERLRIARDLHDVVAHHVSVMGVQSAAARRVLDSDREQARTSLAAVEHTARTAIGELRGLLGVLRADGPEPASEPTPTGAGAGTAATSAGAESGPVDDHPAAPTLDQVRSLVADTEQAGLRVAYAAYGEPRPIPEAVGLSAYRVVQEALTNVVKHAGAGSAGVRIRYLDDALEVEIGDDGRGAPAGERTGTGLGLIGMRERVAVHGGSLEVGPRREGGFQVRARFPVPTATAVDRAPAGAA